MLFCSRPSVNDNYPWNLPIESQHILAYTSHKFLGSRFPHIDPVKEAEASRLKLGTAAAHLPLGNADDETETLMSGDFDTNVERMSREIKEAERLGIKPVLKVVPNETDKKE